MERFQSVTSGLRQVLLCLYVLMLALTVQAVEAEASSHLSIITQTPVSRVKSDFDVAGKAYIEKCSKCEVHWITGESKVSLNELPKLIRSVEDSTQVLYFHWNDRFQDSDPQQKELIQALKSFVQGNRIVVVAPGSPTNQTSAPYAISILKQVPEVVLIGDLMGRDVMPQRSFFGPEMVSALKTKGDEGTAALQFASRLTANWFQKSASEWVRHFQKVRVTSRKIWPEIDDFFR